jgi:Tfp pilus assembly protein PilP
MVFVEKTKSPSTRACPGLTVLTLVVAGVVVGVAGCGEEVQSTGRRSVGGGSGASKGSGNEAKKSSARRRRSRRRRTPTRRESVPELTEQDFMENPEANRDPFRSYLQPEVMEAVEASFEDTRVVLLERYELNELEVTGVVGRRRRYAMFRSPDKRTTNVRKGVRLSKSKALVVEVAEDHVILQIPQLTEGKRATFVERILWVDPNRRAEEISSRPLKPDEEGIRYSGWRRRRYRARQRRRKEAAP